MTDLLGVVGGAGFVGNRIVERLTLQGCSVRPITRTAAGLAQAARFGILGRVADALDTQAVAKALEGCDVAVHAIAGPPKVIVASADAAYRACEKAGVKRLVYLSSASVHGQSPAEGTTESSPLSDRQPLAYNNAKVQAERNLARLRQGGNVELVILRPGIVHGPRSQWIASFANRLVDGTASLVDRGRGLCNSIFIDNLVEAVRLASSAATADGNAYLVGDVETVTWADLFRPVSAYFGVDLDELPEAQLYIPGRFARARTQFAESSAADHLRRRFPAALKAAIKTYRSHGRVAAATPASPVIDWENWSLQSCRVKLPHDRAAKDLGYVPPFAFADACRRTVSWLDFVGYREFA